MKDTIRQLIQQALTRLVTEGVLPEGLTPAIQVENARDKTHGDFASNIAMMLAKPAGMKPRDLAEKLIAALPADEQVSKVEIAGPGFLNFFRILPRWPRASTLHWPTRTCRRVRRAPHSAWSSICRHRTWPRKCTLAICARPLLATAWQTS